MLVFFGKFKTSKVHSEINLPLSLSVDVVFTVVVNDIVVGFESVTGSSMAKCHKVNPYLNKF